MLNALAEAFGYRTSPCSALSPIVEFDRRPARLAIVSLLANRPTTKACDACAQLPTLSRAHHVPSISDMDKSQADHMPKL
jgi:hypothetical protein